ncbi:MAG: fused MFS/spermidine synthase, partial [Desulfatiglandales bacterium]
MVPLGLIYLLFFLSGACGLIYEVLWLRLLEKVTGSSPVAISILLGTFMAGLGAGSFLGGKVAHGINPKERLFFIYGALEGAIGIWALLIPIFATLLAPLLSFFYNIAQSGSGIYYLGCLLVGLLILFVPTCLMGFTLPILIQYAEASSNKVGPRSGLLYGFNTAGGAIGALFAGFVGIPLMGTNMTLLVAISVSLSIFVTSYLLYRSLSLRRVRSPVRESKIDSKFSNSLDTKTKVLGLIFLVSGIVSISFEIIWTNLLALLIGPTTYSFSIVVSTYIIGIGFGSLLFSKFFRKNQGIELIILMQFIMALSFLLISQVMGNSQLFFSKLIFTFKDNLILLWLLKGCLLFVLMLPPTIISGGMFPLILNVLSPKNEEAGGKAGFIYGLNTIGCIIGAILTGFLLMPYLGKIYSIKLLVSVQVFAVACFGIYLTRSQGIGFRGYRRSYLFGGIILVLSYILPQWDVSLLSYGRYHNFSGITSLIHRFGWIESFFRGNSALRSYEKAREILFQGDGLNGFTVVERYYDSAGKEKLSLITSGKPDASSHGDRATQTMLAHVPLLFHPDPKDIMVLGLASGMTAGEVLLYPIGSLDVVEINPQVLKASELFLSYNNNLLKDPRVRIVLQDG